MLLKIVDAASEGKVCALEADLLLAPTSAVVKFPKHVN